jgi:hypothetical protein
MIFTFGQYCCTVPIRYDNQSYVANHSPSLTCSALLASCCLKPLIPDGLLCAVLIWRRRHDRLFAVLVGDRKQPITSPQLKFLVPVRLSNPRWIKA